MIDKHTSAYKRIMIICGEASGDLHGANLVHAMRQLDHSLQFYGIGGNRLHSAGVNIIYDARLLSVVGIWEVVSKLPVILKGLRTAKRFIQHHKPDLLILIDYPEFNLNVAKFAKKYHVPVLYYISPQIWAWRSERINIIKARVNHMAVILPFEAQFYEAHQVPVTFVGNPLLDKPESEKKQTIATAKFFKHPDTTFIGLFPGSRESEIYRHLSVMIEAANRISEQIQNVRFVVPVAPFLNKEIVKKTIKGLCKKAIIDITTFSVDKVLPYCSLVIAASGTVTLECAIAGIPMGIIYKMSPISYAIGKKLIRVNHVSLVNLIANERIVPEFIQHEANPETIANWVCHHLRDDNALKQIKINLKQLQEKLGQPGASLRTATIALQLIHSEKRIYP
ncbi:MAG: lipid-A-disaccharide synthase [Desulfobacterales bacterium]|nr:lipid-A-disaccharide synthase [Desulfobacterales bacterium]